LGFGFMLPQGNVMKKAPSTSYAVSSTPIIREAAKIQQRRATWLNHSHAQRSLLAGLVVIIQLRDSAGLSPASPLSPGIRAEGHPYRGIFCCLYEHIMYATSTGDYSTSDEKQQLACDTPGQKPPAGFPTGGQSVMCQLSRRAIR
jgi:hypothetical protein